MFFIDELFDLYRYHTQTDTAEKLQIGKTDLFYDAENGLY